MSVIIICPVLSSQAESAVKCPDIESCTSRYECEIAKRNLILSLEDQSED